MPSAASHALSEEVVEFCEARHLLGHLETALRIAEQTLQPIDRLSVTIESDPESDEETVVVDVWIRATVDEGLSRKAAFTRQWIDSVPASIVGQIILLHYLI
jgi:hypothetical protein